MLKYKISNVISQIFAFIPSEHSGRILCGYVNATSQIQITRIVNISNWYFECVIFPGQRLLFEALPNAQLEIHMCVTPSAIVSDKIFCAHLRINVREQLVLKTSYE